MPAGGFDHRLAGGGVPFHRRAETRVEIRVARRDHAEFKGAAADMPFKYRPILEIFSEAAAVLVTAAMHDDDAFRRRRPGADRRELAAVLPAHRRPRAR